MGKITTKEYILFDGEKGWQKNGIHYRLACNPVLSQAPDGDVLCTWLSGTDQEPSTDNCILISRSRDGHVWSEPEVFVPAGEMAGGGGVLPLQTNQGKMLAFSVSWPVEKLYTEWHYGIMTSGDNARTWSKPRAVSLQNEDNIALGSPIKLKNGQVLFPASLFEKRATPLRAPYYKIAHAKTEEEALAMPEDPGFSWDGDGPIRFARKFATHRHGCVAVVFDDENLLNFEVRGKVINRPMGLIEPTVIELKDGRLAMLMRAEWGGFLWRADSSDGGYTWTNAYQTDIPNPGSLTHMSRLADGRIALIHNNNGGVVGQLAQRDPLSIWISDDELQSWSIKENVGTGGRLAYPNSLVLHDGSFVFAYDFNRRQVRYIEVTVD